MLPLLFPGVLRLSTPIVDHSRLRAGIDMKKLFDFMRQLERLTDAEEIMQL